MNIHDYLEKRRIEKALVMTPGMSEKECDRLIACIKNGEKTVNILPACGYDKMRSVDDILVLTDWRENPVGQIRITGISYTSSDVVSDKECRSDGYADRAEWEKRRLPEIISELEELGVDTEKAIDLRVERFAFTE